MPVLVKSLEEGVDREACIRLLARDPIHHLMLLGDLYPPLISVSEIYVATDEGRFVGVGSLFRGFSTPSVIITEGQSNRPNRTIDKNESSLESEWITLSTCTSSSVFCQFGNRIYSHIELQMLLHETIPTPVKPARLIQRGEFDLLNQFYNEHRVEAWTPLDV